MVDDMDLTGNCARFEENGLGNSRQCTFCRNRKGREPSALPPPYTVCKNYEQKDERQADKPLR